MVRKGFKMFLYPGMAEEYEKRHNALWPEMKEMIHEYQADGVVEIILQSCHTYNIEAHFIKRTVEAEGIPYLMIETDYSKSDQGQIATRLEALLETIS